MKSLRRRRRNGDVSRQQWRNVTREHLRQWHGLDEKERARLEERAFRLLDKHWEAARGFTVDDAMRITIASHAALLVLGWDEDLYRNVTAVVVHPRSMVLRQERPGPSRGVVTRSPFVAHGHTSWTGPVFLAWSDVQRSLHDAQRTTNVILHEFAHKIDALNGTLDGTPPLTEAQLQRWVDVCSEELEALRRGTGTPVLRSYAATNPSEFFAVATEAFFGQPQLLQEAHPQLYDVLRGFYRQDTAAREQA